MDILSSQANLAGYHAVIDAAQEFNRVLPLFMTAAGKVTPANVLVIGAGVAGLQAIATAKRLGAIVYATDVRIASKEQIGRHTSELQSHHDLVCRLLLEKKKKLNYCKHLLNILS